MLVCVGGTENRSNSDFVHSQDMSCAKAIMQRCLSNASVTFCFSCVVSDERLILMNETLCRAFYTFRHATRDGILQRASVQHVFNHVHTGSQSVPCQRLTVILEQRYDKSMEDASQNASLPMTPLMSTTDENGHQPTNLT